MARPILIYGANGFSGRRIVEEAARQQVGPLILAGRNGAALQRLASRHAVDFRVFALDDARSVRNGLAGVGVVLNAAGPFAFTAERLAKSAIAMGCDYVDISGEADVYQRLDDLGHVAQQRGVALVSGAGFTAGASSWMLERALQGPLAGTTELGSIRVAFSAVESASRGSLEVVWRSMREQVLVVRPRAGATGRGEAAIAYVPQGQLLRDFRLGPRRMAAAGACEPRVATCTAASLIDTLTAHRALVQHRCAVACIESYVEAGPWRRLAQDAAALLAPVSSFGPLRMGFKALLPLLPEGPAQAECNTQRQSVLLQIEDPWRRTLVEWCMQSPNPYDATAALALDAAVLLRDAAVPFAGWLTPGQVLAQGRGPDAWRGFELVCRAGVPP